jgi:hypothetical protein
MLGSEYCLARAEQLRLLMLTASDPADQIRLKEYVQKYRALADRAKKEVGPRPLSKTAA